MRSSSPFVTSLHSSCSLTRGDGSGPSRDANAVNSIPPWKGPVTTIDVPLPDRKNLLLRLTTE